MKKTLALLVALLLVVLAVAGCAPKKEEPKATDAPKATEVVTDAPTEAPTAEPAKEEAKEEPKAEEVAVMTYEEFAAAAVDSKVCVETYVQDKQGWWEKDGQGVATFYTQAEDGAYFLYNMPIAKEDYDKLVPGTKLKVTGFKAEWSGEVEIIDATYEVLEGNFVAEAMDATALLGTEDLIKSQNKLVAFKGLTVENSKDADGKEAAFLYKWNGSGAEGDDLYFNASVNGNTYTFVVESYLRGVDTDVYKAVKELKAGDKVDLEGFLYWYEGPQAHITSVTAAK